MRIRGSLEATQSFCASIATYGGLALFTCKELHRRALFQAPADSMTSPPSNWSCDDFLKYAVIVEQVDL